MTVRELMYEMRWEISPGKCFIALLLYWQPREMGDSRILYLLRGESADASGSGWHRFAALAFEGEKPTKILRGSSC